MTQIVEIKIFTIIDQKLINITDLGSRTRVVFDNLNNITQSNIILPLEDKIHMIAPPYNNILYMIF